MRKSVFAMICILFSLCLCACTTEYERDDIAQLIKNDMGISDFILSEDYRAVEGEDGYTDKIWSVSIPDSGVEFHIIDDFYWGMEAVTNTLYNDYPRAVLFHVKDKLPKTDYLTIRSETDRYGIFQGSIIGQFENPEELGRCYTELEKMKNSFCEMGYSDLRLWYELQYIHPLRYVTSYQDQSGDSRGYITDEFNFQDMENKLIITALDYRFEIISRFTDRQIDAALKGYHAPVGIYRGRRKEESEYQRQDIEYYHNIIASPYSYGISFGSLYEILKLEGFDVRGSRDHYSFTGSDGSVYEISYDFCDGVFETNGETKNGFYYLKDGSQVLMDAYFYTHFTTRQIQRMTGLSLVDEAIN